MPALSDVEIQIGLATDYPSTFVDIGSVKNLRLAIPLSFN
jgi:hypothetical protein